MEGILERVTRDDIFIYEAVRGGKEKLSEGQREPKGSLSSKSIN